MPEGTYNAGTIFLQVVPVFKDVQDRIADNAREWDKSLGDEMEKSGRKAGERANKAMTEEIGKGADAAGKRAGGAYAGHFETSVKGAIRSAQKEIDALDFSKIYDQMRELNKGGADNEWVKSFGRGVDEATRKVEQIKRKLKDLNDLDFSVDFDAKQVLNDVALVEGAVRKLLNADHDLEISANLVQVLKDLQTIETRAKQVAKDKHEIQFGVKADLKQVDRAMGSFEKRFRETAKRSADGFGDAFDHRLRQVRGHLDSLAETEINLDMDASAAMADLIEVRAYLETILGDETIGIDVRSDVKSAVANIEALQKAVRDLEPEVERASGAFERKLRRAAKGVADSLGEDLTPALRRVREEFQALGDLEIGVDLNGAEALAGVARLQAELETMLTDQSIDISVRDNIKGAVAELEAMKKALDLLPPKVERVSGAFERKLRQAVKNGAAAIGDELNPELQQLKARLETLGDAEIGVDMSAEAARNELRAIEVELRRLAKSDPTIDVNLAATAAMGELYAFREMINKLDGREIDIRIDTNAKTAAASMGLLNRVTSLFTPAASGAAGSGDAAANSFRSFNFVILAAVVLLPALIPMIAALGGALLALLPILGALVGGIGVMVIGFSGIGDAVKALGEVEKSAGKDTEAAAQKMRDAAYAVADARRALAEATASAAQANVDAARAVEDAERQAGRASADAARAVADAREQAAEAIENAIERQRQAQEAYRDSVKEVKEAERDLAEARKAGYEEIDNTEDAVKQNALDERQGVVDVFNAFVANEAVQADGSSTNLDKEQAAINLEQARLRLEEIREEEKRLAAEKKKHDKEGVKGTEAVENAQDALTNALEAQQQAQEDLGDAAAAVDEARVEGAEAVADALRNQAQVAADGARSIADARRNEARTAESGARSIASARRGLERAEERYQDALTETEEIGSESMRKLEEAMGKLGPAGRKFARFLFSLRGGFRDIRDAVQENMLPPIQNALGLLIGTYGPGFEDWAGRMAAVVGGFFEQMAVDMVFTDSWRDFFAMIDSYGPSMLDTFGDTTLNWMQIYAELLTQLAPYGERLNEALLGLSESTLDWISSSEGMEDISRFMDYAFEIGPKVVDFFWNLWRAFVAIGVALAPWGEMVMGSLSALFDYIAEMDPTLLGVIASSLVTIAIAFQLAVGAAALAFAGAAVFASAGARYVFFAVLIAGAIAQLYHQFEFVRDIVNAIAGFFKDHMNIIKGLVKIYLIYIGVMKVWTALMVGGIVYTKAMIFFSKLYAFTMKAVAFAQKLWTLATKIGMAVQAAFWAVMAIGLGPLLLIIAGVVAVIAIFVLLYKKVGWFRDAVDFVIGGIVKAFNLIVDAAFWVWDQLFGHSIFPDIVDGLLWFFDQVKKIAKWVGEAFLWLYEHFLKPVGEAIMAIAPYIWKGIKLYFGLILLYWKTVFWAMKTAWTKILWPAFKALIAIVKFLWKNVVKPYLGLVVAYWKKVFQAMKWVWQNVVKPVFDALKKVFGFLWDKVVRPLMGKILEKWETVFRAMKLVWDNVLAPIFKKIREDALPALKRAFDTVVENIGKAWDKIKKIVGKPIEFVVNTVIRDGLIKGFNKVSSFVKGPEIDFPGVAFKYASGGVFGRRQEPGYAAGGILPGYTPGQDVHHFTSPTGGSLHLSGGEPIMRPEFGAVVGHGWVDRVNEAARSGGVPGVKAVLGLDQRHARGGVFWPTSFRTLSPDYPGHTGVDISIPGTGDLGKPVYATNPGKAYSFFSGTPSDPSYGNTVKIVHSDNAYESWYGHLMNPGLGGQGVTRTVKAGQIIGQVGSTGNSTGPHLHFEIRPGGTRAAALAYLGGAPLSSGGGAKALKPVDERFPDWIIDIAKNPVGWAKGLVTDPLKDFGERFGDMGDFSSNITDVPKAIVGKFSAKVWDMIPDPVQDFVGGAKKVFSGATDFGGDVIGGIGDATGAVAGFLGDLGGAGSGEYRRGGVLPHNGTMMYDNGGYLPPGLTSVVNLTGKPEPVFTSDQFERMGSGGTSAGFHYEPHFEGSDLTAADVATDVDRAYRKMKRQGKYGKQG